MQQTCIHIHIKTHIHTAPINRSINQSVSQSVSQPVSQSARPSVRPSASQPVAADRVLSCRGPPLSPPRSAPQPQVSTRWPGPLSLALLCCRVAALPRWCATVLYCAAPSPSPGPWGLRRSWTSARRVDDPWVCPKEDYSPIQGGDDR